MDKLITLNDNQLTDVKIILLMGAKNHLGIANLPNENDLNQIVLFLKSKFGEFTPQEIEIALQMYSCGSITVENKPYGVLSTLFLSEVFNQYRIHRKMAKDIHERKMNEQKQLMAPKKDPDEVNKNLTEFLVQYISENNCLPESYAWDEVFLHLEKIKEIDLAVEDKKDFVSLQREELIERIEYYKNVVGKKQEVLEMLRLLNDTKAMQSYCRRKLVHLYFENKLNQSKNGSNTNKAEA